MNWWYAKNESDAELYIRVDRWFNAKSFAKARLGESADTILNEGTLPPRIAFEQGKVFEGVWSKHDAAPGSALNFKQLSPDDHDALVKAMEEERKKEESRKKKEAKRK